MPGPRSFLIAAMLSLLEGSAMLHSETSLRRLQHRHVRTMLPDETSTTERQFLVCIWLPASKPTPILKCVTQEEFLDSQGRKDRTDAE